MKGYKTNYAWIRNVGTFGKVEPNPDETLCAWCKKSQTQILNEHLEEHDTKSKE